MIIVIVLAFGAMWFMTNRSRKQQRQAGDFRANLEVGQEVMTGSGLYGTIVAVDGDTITLESTPGNQTRWIRAAVSKLVVPPVVDEVDEDYDDDDDATDEADADYDDADYDDATDDDTGDDDATVDDDADAEATDEADDTTTLESADGAVIDVPDDLSTLPGLREDDDPQKK